MANFAVVALSESDQISRRAERLTPGPLRHVSSGITGTTRSGSTRLMDFATIHPRLRSTGFSGSTATTMNPLFAAGARSTGAGVTVSSAGVPWHRTAPPKARRVSCRGGGAVGALRSSRAAHAPPPPTCGGSGVGPPADVWVSVASLPVNVTAPASAQIPFVSTSCADVPVIE